MNTSARQLPPPLAWRHAVRAQVRLIMTGKQRALRFLWLGGLALVALTVLPVSIPVIEVGPGPDGAEGVKTLELNWWRLHEIPVFEYPELSSLLVIYQALLFIGLFWPLSVWRDEPPDERDAFRSLPVAAPGHELARVAAGALWLIALSVALPALVTLGLLATERGGSLHVFSVRSWIHCVTGPLTLYLLSSCAALLARRPLRAILLTFAALFVPFILFATYEIQWGYDLLHAVIGGELSYSTAIGGPAEDILGIEPGIHPRDGPSHLPAWATVLWLAVGLAGVVIAVRRTPEG